MNRNSLGGKWKCYVTGRWCTKLNLRKLSVVQPVSLRIEKYSFLHGYFFFFLLKFKIRICIRVCIYRLFSDSARPYFIGIIVYRSCQSSSGRNKRPISHKTVTTCWFEMTRFDRESRSRKIKIRSLASLVYIIQNDAIWSRISNS